MDRTDDAAGRAEEIAERLRKELLQDLARMGLVSTSDPALFSPKT